MKRYRVRIADKWYSPLEAHELRFGWLMWKDHKGHNGLSCPRDWRTEDDQC